MNRRWTAVAAAGMLCLMLAALLHGVNTTGTDAALYVRLEDEIGRYDYVGVSREETALALGDLAAYLRGQDVALDREVTMFGERKSVFNDREIAHMKDVRGLFDLSRLVEALGWAAGGAAMLLIGLFCRERCAKALLAGAGIAWGIVLLAVGAGLLVGFDRLFIGFHHLFFHNDLWLMDPRTDAMIRMLPQWFFEQMALRVVRPLAIVGAQAAGAAVCLGVFRLAGKKRNPAWSVKKR